MNEFLNKTLEPWERKLGEKIEKPKVDVPEWMPVDGKPGFYKNAKGELQYIPEGHRPLGTGPGSVPTPANSRQSPWSYDDDDDYYNYNVIPCNLIES